MNMRKFLVKHFVLDYRVNLFGSEYTAPRASRIIYPLMFITGIQVAINPNYPKPDMTLWISYFITALALFFGFVYFRIKPANFDELDSDQKRQYGYFLNAKLTEEQLEEWRRLVLEYENRK